MERKCEKGKIHRVNDDHGEKAINGAFETEYRGEIDQRLVCFKHAK